MSDRHASLYLMSRLAAAVLNLAAVAAFTRLAPPAVFGSYLVSFATAFIAFGTLFQWLLHAHFGVYQPARAARTAGALLVLIVAMSILGGTGLLLGVLTGALTGSDALGLALLGGGLTIHTAAVEIGRAQLRVRAVATAGLLRGLLMLGMGSGTLLLWPTALPLMGAIGLAQALAALPVLIVIRREGIARPETQDLRAMLRYGWPLIGALAAGAIALNLDRLALGWSAGVVVVAAYGASVDVIRQGFVVLGEAIAAAYVSEAKAKADHPAARAAALKRALTTLWSVVLFGALVWIGFGHDVLGLIFAPDYVEASANVLPLLVLGTALMVLRAFYFGQVIYFAGSARREVLASGAMVTLAVLGCLTLVPPFGVTGAALTLCLTQGGGLAALLVADRQSRIMPIDTPALFTATLWVAATALPALMLRQLPGAVGWTAGVTLTLASALALAIRWNLFDARRLLTHLTPRRSQ